MELDRHSVEASGLCGCAMELGPSNIRLFSALIPGMVCYSWIRWPYPRGIEPHILDANALRGVFFRTLQ